MSIFESHSVASEFLHQITLGSRFVSKLSYILDKNQTPIEASVPEENVFICGLARSGTTMILRRLYDTGAFASLIYHDMPFPLMPGIWNKFRPEPSCDFELRAHCDRIKVNQGSPEALEEIFWRTFEGANYIGKRELNLHCPGRKRLQHFREFIRRITFHQGKQRYLSKNNNNILRIKSIKDCFPNSSILIPFRAPHDHATSLLKQHLNFIEIQKKSTYTRRYMDWSGHYEFGLDHKHFKLNHQDCGIAYSKESIDYWADVWTKVYRYLLENAPDSCLFLPFEHLTDPKSWSFICHFLGLPKGSFNNAETWDPPSNKITGCNEIYNEMVLKFNESLEAYEC